MKKFTLILLISLNSLSHSFFEISKNDRLNDLICVSHIDQIENKRVYQLVKVLTEIDDSMEGRTFQKLDNNFDGDCFTLSLIPDEFKYLPAEIIYQLQSQDKSLEEIKKDKKKKFIRTDLYMTGGQLITVGAIFLLPRSFTNWKSDGLVKNAPNQFIDAFTKPPAWDKDGFGVNYIGHPYSGSLYYNAVRSTGSSPLKSFLYSAYKSTMWEYLIESWFEQPSTQDLIVTPILGSLLGEGSHQLTMKMKKNGFSSVEKLVVALINPTYVLQNGFK